MTDMLCPWTQATTIIVMRDVHKIIRFPFRLRELTHFRSGHTLPAVYLAGGFG